MLEQSLLTSPCLWVWALWSPLCSSSTPCPWWTLGPGCRYDAFMTGAAFAGLCSLYPALTRIPAMAASQNVEREENGATEAAYPSEAEASPAAIAPPAEGSQSQAAMAAVDSEVGTPREPLGSSDGAAEGAPAPGAAGAAVGWIPDSVGELCNRVHLMNCTVNVLPLDGPLPTPDRTGTFLLSNLGPADNGAAIQKLFVSSGLGIVTQIWLQNVPTAAPAEGTLGTAMTAGEGAGGPNGGGRSRGRNGRGPEGGGPSRDLSKRVMVVLEDPQLGPQVAQVLAGSAPHLAVTPWDHIPAPLLHACLNAGTSFQGAWTPGPASRPRGQAGSGGGVRARAEGGDEESRPSKALRTEGPSEGRSSCSIM